MRILILNWKDIKHPTAGGAELVTYEHAKRWVKAGHEVIWLASSFKSAKEKEVMEGISIRRFGNIYGVYLYAPWFYLFGGFKFDFVIDEVHGIPFFTPLYVRKPKLVLIHEVAGEIWNYMYSFPFNILGRFLERFYLLLYRNNYFWTDCKATVDEIVEYGIKRKKCISIPCPSNVKVINTPNIKPKPYKFIAVSRIVKMKGIEEVIKSFALINEKHPNTKLQIIGGGEKKYINFLKQELVIKNKLEGKVEFLGFLSEKEKIKHLKQAFLMLHASVKEGWGIVVIEAASQSTPSVVYDVPGLSESVKNKTTGIVIKNTPEEMANAAISLIGQQNTYRKYQKNCLEWAKSLNWDESSKQSLEKINRIYQK